MYRENFVYHALTSSSKDIRDGPICNPLVKLFRLLHSRSFLVRVPLLVMVESVTMSFDTLLHDTLTLPPIFRLCLALIPSQPFSKK